MLYASRGADDYICLTEVYLVMCNAPDCCCASKEQYTMHDIAAMDTIMRDIARCMQETGAARVTNVQLVLGASGHLTGEAAHRHFEFMVARTPVEGASLSIAWIPALYQCTSCANRFESCESREGVMCPRCGKSAIEVEHQNVCYVSAVDVAFPDEVNAQATTSEHVRLRNTSFDNAVRRAGTSSHHYVCYHR